MTRLFVYATTHLMGDVYQKQCTWTKCLNKIFSIIMNKTLRKRPPIIFTLRGSTSDIIIFYASATFKTVLIIYIKVTSCSSSSCYNYQYLKYYTMYAKNIGFGEC